MKIVVNRCFGGFGLSIEAQLKINEIGCEYSRWITDEKYFSAKESEEEKNSHCKFCGIPRKDNMVLIDEHGNDRNRGCLVLVKIVEEMDEKANGRLANLEVVEIPDDVEWVIDEYDGSESVEEAHRSW